MYIVANSDVYFDTSESVIVSMNDALTDNAETNVKIEARGHNYS